MKVTLPDRYLNLRLDADGAPPLENGNLDVTAEDGSVVVSAGNKSDANGVFNGVQWESASSFTKAEFTDVGSQAGFSISDYLGGWDVLTNFAGAKAASITIDKSKSYLFKVIDFVDAVNCRVGYSYVGQDFTGTSIGTSIGSENETMGFDLRSRQIFSSATLSGVSSTTALVSDAGSLFCYVNFATNTCIIANDNNENESITYEPTPDQKFCFKFNGTVVADDRIKIILDPAEFGTVPASIPNDWIGLGDSVAGYSGNVNCEYYYVAPAPLTYAKLDEQLAIHAPMIISNNGLTATQNISSSLVQDAITDIAVAQGLGNMYQLEFTSNTTASGGWGGAQFGLADAVFASEMLLASPVLATEMTSVFLSFSGFNGTHYTAINYRVNDGGGSQSSSKTGLLLELTPMSVVGITLEYLTSWCECVVYVDGVEILRFHEAGFAVKSSIPESEDYFFAFTNNSDANGRAFNLNFGATAFAYPVAGATGWGGAGTSGGQKHPPVVERGVVPVEVPFVLDDLYITYNKQFDAGDTSKTVIDGTILNSPNWDGLGFFNTTGKVFDSIGWLNTGAGTLGSMLTADTSQALEEEIRNTVTIECSGFVRLSSTEDIQSPSFERTVLSVGGTSGDLLCGLILTTDYIKYFNDTSGVRQEVSVNYTFANGNSYDVYFSRDNAGNVILYVDGVNVGGGVVTAPLADTVNATMYTGNNANLSEAGIGGVYEASIIHNKALTSSEFNILRGELI